MVSEYQPYSFGVSINFLQNDKNLDLSKFKAFDDDKINVTEKLEFLENWRGRKCSVQFSFFLDVFNKIQSSQGRQKTALPEKIKKV